MIRRATSIFVVVAVTLAAVAAICLVSQTEAFAPSSSLASRGCHHRQAAKNDDARSCFQLSMAVVDIDGEAAFDKTIKSAGESLVVVDYSTTW